MTKVKSVQLSICIPAYNRPQWLQRALLSIDLDNPIVQETVEIIISDDSTNPTCFNIVHQVMNGWAGNWKYVHNQPSLGMANNWNQAVKLASGRYILILHDDDFLLKHAVRLLLDGINAYAQKYPVLLFGVHVVNERERLLRRQTVPTPRWLAPKQALINVLSHSSFVRFPAIVIQRQAFETIGYFDPTVGGPADIEQWMRLVSQFGLMQIPSVTCAYTVHAQALTMGMFNIDTVRTVLDLFQRATEFDLLSLDELEAAKSDFFHQFILAGTFRQIRRGRLKRSYEVMELFKSKELSGLRSSKKWRWVRYLFEAYQCLITPIARYL